MTDPKLNQITAIKGSFVQTERKAHEEWAALIARKPRAAQLLHLIIAHMDQRGALIASQNTLSALAGVSLSTTKRALSDLVSGRWIQTVRIGSERGGALAYIVNSRIAWADRRENLKYARFSANVLVSSIDTELDTTDLKRLPQSGEQQLPSGVGLPPPSEQHLPGMEPELPDIPAEQSDPDAVFDEPEGYSSGDDEVRTIHPQSTNYKPSRQERRSRARLEKKLKRKGS